MQENLLELFAQAYPQDIHIIKLDNSSCRQAWDLIIPENAILLANYWYLSFRRTALTQMSSAAILLHHIQEISGRNNLGTLQRYLKVSPDQRKKAVSVIRF